MLISLSSLSWNLRPPLGTLVDAPNAVNGAAPWLEELVVMVSERRGRLSFFVSRIDALVAWSADLRARKSGLRGTSRLMTLEAADWTMQESKTVSYPAT